MKAEVPVEPGILLDVGIGPAQFRDVYEHMSVVGVDLYEYPEAQVIADLTQPLPFKHSAFTSVFASNIIEHLYRPQDALREYARVLAPGGKIIGAVPFFIGVHQSPYDFFRYTHFALEQMLQDAGFQSVRVVPLGVPLDTYVQTQMKFFALLEKSIRRRGGPLMYPQIFLKKGVWFVQKTINVLCSPLFQSISTDQDFALGYGFMGIKK